MIAPRLLWVAGGRAYSDEAHMREVLRPYGLDGWVLITGAQRGADLLAERLWRGWEYPYIGIPAKWGLRGRRAGPDRNLTIARYWSPQLLIAFQGGAGTADAAHKADLHGIEVMEA